jgi:hypothetical protein
MNHLIVLGLFILAAVAAVWWIPISANADTLGYRIFLTAMFVSIAVLSFLIAFFKNKGK